MWGHTKGAWYNYCFFHSRGCLDWLTAYNFHYHRGRAIVCEMKIRPFLSAWQICPTGEVESFADSVFFLNSVFNWIQSMSSNIIVWTKKKKKFLHTSIVYMLWLDHLLLGMLLFPENVYIKFVCACLLKYYVVMCSVCVCVFFHWVYCISVLNSSGPQPLYHESTDN